MATSVIADGAKNRLKMLQIRTASTNAAAEQTKYGIARCQAVLGDCLAGCDVDDDIDASRTADMIRSDNSVDGESPRRLLSHV